MNFRKSLVLITFLTCTYSMSAEVVIDDPIIPGKEKTTGKPRTSIPSVEASTSGDELTVDINRYLGNVLVTVCALDGSSTTSNTYYINGHSSFTMDFNGYSTGSYSISIGLQNGTVYSGTFRLE